MEPARSSEPATTPTEAPVAPDLTSGTASVEPGTPVVPPADQSAATNQGMLGRARGVFGGLFGEAPVGETPDQTVTAGVPQPGTEATSTAAMPPSEAVWPITDSIEGTPGIAPRNPDTAQAPTISSAEATPPIPDFTPTAIPVSSPEPSAEWAAQTEQGNPQPIVADTSVAAPTPEPIAVNTQPVADPSAPAIEGTSPDDLQTAGTEFYRRRIGGDWDPTSGLIKTAVVGKPTTDKVIPVENPTRKTLSLAEVKILGGLLKKLDPRIFPDAQTDPAASVEPETSAASTTSTPAEQNSPAPAPLT